MMKKKITRIVVMSVAVVGIFSIGYLARGYYDSMQKTNAKNTASIFIHDLTAGNNAAAYKMTTAVLQKSQMADKFSTNIGNLKSTNVTYDSPKVLNDGATVIYTQHANNLPKTDTGKTDGTFYLKLTKQGMSYKVSTVTIN
jgi:hypothetical protein